MKERGQQCIELKGSPFHAPNDAQDVEGTRIHCAIVRCMLACGWEIACSSQNSLSISDIHSFFFIKGRCIQAEICAITFVAFDTIRTTDASVEFVELLQQVFETKWPAVKYSVKSGSPEFQLKGNLWHASGDTAIFARQMLLAQLLSKMAASGYRVLTSAQTRVTNAGMRPQELDTWIIINERS